MTIDATIYGTVYDAEGNRESRSHRIMLRIEPSLYAALKEQAEQSAGWHSRGVSALIRRYCIAALQAKKT